jgi:hypothetical protein
MRWARQVVQEAFAQPMAVAAFAITDAA